MSELTELRKEIAGLFSGLAKSKNALRKIEARVAKALAGEKEPDLWPFIKGLYGKPFEELECPEGFHWSLPGALPEVRQPQKKDWFLTADKCLPWECAISGLTGPRLILIPIEPKPDVYEQIREWYGKPFSELQGPFKSDFGGWFVPMMADGLPVFNCASPGFGMQEYLMTDGTVGCGYFSRRHIILRPANRVGYVEDPEGTHVTTATGGMALFNLAAPRHCIRYRREEQA